MPPNGETAISHSSASEHNESTMKVLIVLVSIAPVAFAQWNCPKYDTIVLKDTAMDAEGLSSIGTNFTELLGGENNGNSAGPLEGGQRSINWDAPIVPFDMAGDFFNVNVTRGAVFYTEGGQFAVSNPSSPPPQDDRFSSLLPESISERFRRFSLERLFTPVLSNQLNVNFDIPATTTKAKGKRIWCDSDIYSFTTTCQDLYIDEHRKIL
ncbi:hypothetical protein FGB62_38g24 [Gracilaria domingensis]|nr:hypothetical protein FGB62_38g24 [Gracilaria domingensis]